MEKKHLAVTVTVIESERGWGSKVDGYMVCLSMEDAKLFTKEFNSKNTAEVTPSWYTRADDSTPIDITDKQFKELQKTENKRMWLSALKKII